VALYYAFIGLQVAKNYYLQSLGDVTDPKKKKHAEKVTKTADRSVGNMLEQAMPFLVSLWLHASFVGPDSATNWGWYYLASRSIYPLAFYLGVPYLLLSTLPGYFVIFKLISPCYTSSA
jgi:uncharacterized MAPEG superfamily protein